MGDERSEEIDIIPAKVVVKVHIRKKYGECGCQGFILKTAVGHFDNGLSYFHIRNFGCQRGRRK
jgi:hypothetical protein